MNYTGATKSILHDQVLIYLDLTASIMNKIDAAQIWLVSHASI